VFGTHYLRGIPTGLTYKTIIMFPFSLPYETQSLQLPCDDGGINAAAKH
jgi:hypothetical protein